MAMQDIALLGYTLDEYCHMFDLKKDDLKLKILDCAAGPASVNAELTQQGGEVISCDPLYELPCDLIKERINSHYAGLAQSLAHYQAKFNWDRYPTIDSYINLHHKAIEQFYQDYPQGITAQRYQRCLLPQLPFADFEFDLCLCSHFLFAKHYDHSQQFIVTSILEMCRVAHEARIFPLLDPQGEVTDLAGPVAVALQQQGYGVEIRQVPYEFQKGGNAMLRVWANECQVG